MSSLNKIQLIGRLGQDPELKTGKSGNPFCNFSIATSEKRDGAEETQWHRCIAFKKSAEIIAQFKKKGDEIYVEGKMVYGSYTNKDGVRVNTAEVMVNHFVFIGGGSKGSGDPAPPANGVPDDDLPF